MVVKPLYNHTSESTAYIVPDYPYGRLRCQIKYWLEHNPNKGYRLVSQTENPKTGRWNAPKKSTYVSLAAAMYLDEKNHVVWKGISEYSKPEEVISFIQEFPEAATPLLKAWCLKKHVYSKGRAEGKIFFTINGVKQDDTHKEQEDNAKEAEQWLEASRLIPAS